MSKLYPQLMEHVNITVYDVADKILPMFDEKLSKYAQENAGREGVTIKTSHSITELKRGFPRTAGAGTADYHDDVKASGFTLALKNGEESEVGCGLVVWSTGLMANPFVEKALSSSFVAPASCVRMLSDINASPRSSDANWKVQRHPRSGSIITDDFCRVQLSAADSEQGKPAAVLRDVYALGDCAVIEGTSYPATAQVATQKAKWLAKKLNKGDINTRGFSFVSARGRRGRSVVLETDKGAAKSRHHGLCGRVSCHSAVEQTAGQDLWPGGVGDVEGRVSDQSDILAQPRADSHVLVAELVCMAKMLGVFGRGAADNFMQGIWKGHLQILVCERARGLWSWQKLAKSYPRVQYEVVNYWQNYRAHQRSAAGPQTVAYLGGMTLR